MVLFLRITVVLTQNLAMFQVDEYLVNYFRPVLRSRYFFGRLRMATVPEPTPTYLGRLRLQAKQGGSGSIH